jgi:hypothetical protein
VDPELRDQIDAIVLERIVTYHRALVSQIKEAPLQVWTSLGNWNPGLPPSLPASGCSQSEHTPPAKPAI